MNPLWHVEGLFFGTSTIVENREPDASLLHLEERARLKEQKSLRRRVEYVAGRIASRIALTQVIDADRMREVCVLTEPNGAPRVANASGLAISITHARLTAIAAISNRFTSIGIDLCDYSDAERIRRVGVRSFALADREFALSSDRHAVASWAIKESLAKTLGMGMLEGGAIRRILVRSIDPPQVTINGDSRAFELRLFEHPEGVLAVSWLVA